MPDLNALIVFAKVIEARSFSQAARRLKIPVSTVSRRVADLEDQLGTRLLERSTRNLRLTEVGADVFEHALRIMEIAEALDGHVSNQLSRVAGTLRLSAPPSISDSLLMPLIGAFQASYPDVRVQVMITERTIDHIADGVDLSFHVGPMRDSALIARRILTYRHQLVASPAYLAHREPPRRPEDLQDHRILAFSHWQPEHRWVFSRAGSTETQTFSFLPHLGINDFAGVTAGLLAGQGVGDLPPIVQPDLMRDGRLVEIMPEWRFPVFDLCLVHLGTRRLPLPVRVFKDFTYTMVQTIFPDLPT
ncbi:LysR family transcriptional regulator [Lichenicoccus roseus]|uniref:LysR family transcriptional regulator n=1 Tax=Lichenicoccus roseus TaxID=2683649 RepID=A0A5R9J2Y7_9PROT|nr:LysR family transcriptional regulator [Lichenicoccus roseus]TLU71995.1 LysR family transcriptional regulator [Lichenicoccus roseus]